MSRKRVTLEADSDKKKTYGKGNKKFSDKQRQEIFDRVIAHYEKDELTLEECCNKENISIRTFYAWLERDEDMKMTFQLSSAKAINSFKSELKRLALSGFKRRLEGETVTTTETEWRSVPFEDPETGEMREKLEIKRVVKKQTYYPPSERLIEFSLKNSAPEHFKDEKLVSVKTDKFEKLSDDELLHEIKKMETLIVLNEASLE